MKLDLHSLLERLLPEQQEQLRAYERLLASRAIPLGLVGEADRSRLWERHVLDSLRAVGCLGHRRYAIADLGSGAGLPGLPVAIARSDCTVALIEARRRRAAFLEQAIEDLELENATVLPHRVEAVTETFDVCTARAFGDAPTSWRFAAPRLRPDGFLLYFAGRTFEAKDGPGMPDVRYEICQPSAFPWQGSLVMMTRIRPSPD